MRAYYFPPDLSNIAYESGLIEAAQTIALDHNEHNPYQDGLYNEELGVRDVLERADTLSRADYTKIQARIAAIAVPGAVWLPDWGSMDRNIHPSEIPVTDTDITTLSGAGGLAYNASGHGDLLEKYTDYGYTSKIEYMVFAGAVLSNQTAELGVSQRLSKASYLASETIMRKIALGPSASHSDFVLHRLSASTRGTASPLGDKLTFSPAIHEMLAAWHTTEASIVAGICAYLIGHPHQDDAYTILEDVWASADEIHPSVTGSTIQDVQAGIERSTLDDFRFYLMMLDAKIPDTAPTRLKESHASITCNNGSFLDIKRPDPANYEMLALRNTGNHDVLFYNSEIPELLGAFMRIDNANGVRCANVIALAMYAMRQKKLNPELPLGNLLK